MSPEQTNAIFEYIGTYMASNGRIAYWNLYIDRVSDTNRIVRLNEISETLKNQDRVWFYKNFHAEEIK